MTIRFIATECGCAIEDGVLTCGASNALAADEVEGRTFIFMRPVDADDPDDDGPYFELDDQGWGDYHGVESVRFAGNVVTVTLNAMQAGLIGDDVIEAVLECPAGDIAQFKDGVRRVYRDQPEKVAGD
jgi:hypothetical protein